MGYNAIDLAKYIVNKCYKDNKPISNLQLQKIMYYIQKDFLHRTGYVAFDDLIEAWQFGPVVPNVYYHFCGYGAMPITITYDCINIAEQDKSYIDKIVEEKRDLDPWELVSETHKNGSAWGKSYKYGCKNVINIDLIKAEE